MRSSNRSHGLVDPTGLLDIACDAVGGEVLYASDEWFAEASSLLREAAPVDDDPPVYTWRGKQMDGWETARHAEHDEHRRSNPDYCIIRLGASGQPRRIIIDTAHFTGNAAASAQVDVCTAAADTAWLLLKDWRTLLPRSNLNADSINEFVVDAARSQDVVTHVRFTMWPDGGIARLRLYSHVSMDWHGVGPCDVADVRRGASIVATSDAFYGAPIHLLLPQRAPDMHSGWETKRSRDKDHTDWSVVKLGVRARVLAIEVDTAHFRGNFPHSYELWYSDEAFDTTPDDLSWSELVPRQRGRGHARTALHIDSDVSARFIKLVLIPDGGVSRLRVYGQPLLEA